MLFPQVQRPRDFLSVRPVGVIAAAPPDKDNGIGVAGFDAPVLRVSCGVQVVLRQLCLRHVAVRGYELVYAPSNGAPCQVHILAAWFAEADAFGVVVLSAAGCTGQRVRSPTYPVQVFEHSGLLAQRVFLGEVAENAPFAARDTAAVRQCISYLVLCYEAVDLRNALHIRCEFAPFEQLRGEGDEDAINVVVVEAQHTAVNLVGLAEGEIIAQDCLAAFRACELCGYLLHGLRVAAVHIRKAGKQALIAFAEVVLQIPEFSCDQLSLVVLGPCDLALCGVALRVQQLAYARSGLRPRYELCPALVTRLLALGNSDAVIGIPHGVFLAAYGKAVAASVDGRQEGGYFIYRAPLLKLRDHAHTQLVGVAAEPEHIVHDLLRKRESGGRLRVLRFVEKIQL